MLVLGIETSCDETGLALYDSDKGLIGQVLYSQVDLHAKYGGVVPELASRDHIRKLLPLLESLFESSGVSKQQIKGVAYTVGPGLVGALLTGALFGRTLAYALNIPAIGVHHMEGHLLAPLLADQMPSLPFVALLVSGGHTQLIRVNQIGSYELIGETIDDAAGEAFDKVAKLLDLPYPGGAQIAKLAESGNVKAFNFPRPMLKQGLDFSFSGLKTSVRTAYQKALAEYDTQNNLDEINALKADIAASFQQAIIETLVKKSVTAMKEEQVKDLVIAGGVSANVLLRSLLETELAKIGGQVHYAPPALCTDNGAMIAYAGWQRLKVGQQDELAIKTRPRWPLEELPSL